MPSQVDEYRFWTTKLADASHNMLQTVQTSAGKWQVAIAAFLGAYATIGFLLTPDKLATLPIHGTAEIILLVAYGLAGALGVAAVVLANLAAQGIPQIRLRTIITGTEYRNDVTNAAVKANCRLRVAIWLAGGARALVLACSAYLLIAGSPVPDIIGLDINSVRRKRGLVVVPVPVVERVPIKTGVGHDYKNAPSSHAPFVRRRGPQDKGHVVWYTKVVVAQLRWQRRLEQKRWELGVGPLHEPLEAFRNSERDSGDVRPKPDLA
jgi:hypothetical protein